MSFHTANETIRNKKQKTKRQPTEWEKIVSSDATDKGLISKIYKQLTQLNSKKTNNPIEKWPKTWIDISPKIYRWPKSTWKNAQHHWSLEKCKSKLLWDTTSHQSEGASLISQQITNAGKSVKKRVPPYTVGGTTMENSMKVPQKIKYRTTVWPRNPTLEHISGQNFHWKRCMNFMFMAAVFHNSQDMETS